MKDLCWVIMAALMLFVLINISKNLAIIMVAMGVEPLTPMDMISW